MPHLWFCHLWPSTQPSKSEILCLWKGVKFHLPHLVLVRIKWIKWDKHVKTSLETLKHDMKIYFCMKGKEILVFFLSPFRGVLYVAGSSGGWRGRWEVRPWALFGQLAQWYSPPSHWGWNKSVQVKITFSENMTPPVIHSVVGRGLHVPECRHNHPR